MLDDALKMLELTSRTFYIPIVRLPASLKEAVTSAYLCLRAIDEIEDHPHLAPTVKVALLQKISRSLQSGIGHLDITRLELDLPSKNGAAVPEVALRIKEWLQIAPAQIAPRIWDATAAMADRMAYWVANNWQIQQVGDLDGYTFSVAGSVGLLLSDLWIWYDGTQTDRAQAVGFGRGLQAVNILRNRAEDLARGVDLFPQAWTPTQMLHYSRENLKLAVAYTQALPAGPVLNFCQLPLALAQATLNALEEGRAKLTREEVNQVVAGVQ